MTHHDILLGRILRDCHENRMAERALSEHLDSLVLIHGARRNQLQRGTSCLAIILSGAAAWSEDVAVEGRRCVGGAFLGVLARIRGGWRGQTSSKGRWETRTVVRATAVWCRLGPNKGLTFCARKSQSVISRIARHPLQMFCDSRNQGSNRPNIVPVRYTGAGGKKIEPDNNSSPHFF